MITVFGENPCDDSVTFCFTQYGDFLGDLPEMVRIEVMKRSPYLVTICVTILSLFVSPNMVNFWVICRNCRNCYSNINILFVYFQA